MECDILPYGLQMGLAVVQNKSLYNVRTAFKLMQTDLDPLLQGVLNNESVCCAYLTVVPTPAKAQQHTHCSSTCDACSH